MATINLEGAIVPVTGASGLGLPSASVCASWVLIQSRSI
ncbi:hypothetical protein FHX03_006397 [Rhizobium sp. BK456]|nr:hypothetical protein [Rhizobium sp. BK456]